MSLDSIREGIRNANSLDKLEEQVKSLSGGKVDSLGGRSVYTVGKEVQLPLPEFREIVKEMNEKFAALGGKISDAEKHQVKELETSVLDQFKMIDGQLKKIKDYEFASHIEMIQEAQDGYELHDAIETLHKNIVFSGDGKAVFVSDKPGKLGVEVDVKELMSTLQNAASKLKPDDRMKVKVDRLVADFSRPMSTGAKAISKTISDRKTKA